MLPGVALKVLVHVKRRIDAQRHHTTCASLPSQDKSSWHGEKPVDHNDMHLGNETTMAPEPVTLSNDVYCGTIRLLAPLWIFLPTLLPSNKDPSTTHHPHHTSTRSSQ